MKGTVVYVRWVDSTSRSGWQRLEGFREDALLCATIGFLVREDDETISIAHSLAFHDGEGQIPDGANNIITIPKCAILGRWEVTGVH